MNSARQDRHAAGARDNARAVFANINANVDQDFHSLTTDQVAGILEEAQRVRYQVPKNANGSKARYFHARLQRQARAPK